MSPDRKNENMGGIFDAEYAFADQIRTCTAVEPTASMYFVEGQKWQPFPHQNKIKIAVQPQDNGIIYSVTCNINITRPNISAQFLQMIEQMKIRPILIRYKQSDELRRVIGSKANPLLLIVEDSTPEINEFNGIILTFAGVQPHRQLLYEEFKSF